VEVTVQITIAPADQRVFTRLVEDARACRRCDRMTHCHALSPANGPLDALVLFVAEAPGRRGAAVTGVPLTRDESGRRFDRFLAVAGIDRAETFVTNSVLCNPTDARGRNRPPSAPERAACRPFIERTLDTVRAPLVVTLGRVALDALRAIEPHGAGLSRDCGCPLAWRGRILVPLYHPSRQSTLYRAEDAQEADWRGLGDAVAMVRRERLAPVTMSRP
jgi:DNA polymerase